MYKENNDKNNTMERVDQEKEIDRELDEAFEMSNSASFMDCTGTVSVAAVTEEQWNNYDDSYHFQPKPAAPQEKRKIFQ